MKFVATALLWVGLIVTPALAADVLSIESNLKFLEDNKKTKGVITRPSGLQFRIIQNGYGKRPQSHRHGEGLLHRQDDQWRDL